MGDPRALTCDPLVGVDSEEATHQGLHWHTRAACFCCSLCRKPLRGQPLTARCGRLFCSESCSLGWDVSSAASTTSDSSDSAFVSAPSPDSTPVSRASHATRAGSTAAAGGCRQRVEGAGRRPECFTCKGLGEKWKQTQALGISLGVQHACSLTQGCSKQPWAPSPHPTAEVWLGQPCSASQDSPCCTSSCSKTGSAFFSLTLPCFPYSRDATGSGLHPSSIQEP